MLYVSYELVVDEKKLNNLHDNIIKKKHFIPYSINATDIKFIEGEYYYISFYGKYFKVISIERGENNEQDYVYVKWEDGCYGMYCTKLDIYRDYILRQDIDSIYKETTLVNNKRIYTGAEIKYWFFTNDITAMNKVYEDFWKYVDSHSDAYIIDSNRYKLVAKVNINGEYEDAKIIRIDTKKIISG